MTRIVRSSLLPLGLLAAVTLSGSGCNRAVTLIPDAPNPEEIPPTDPHRIETFYQLSPEHADSLIKNNAVIHVLDFRPAEAYAAGHLPQAIHLPWDAENFAETVATFNKKTPILAYADLNPDAFAGVHHLRSEDFLNVYWLSLGFPSWVEAKKPVIDGEGKKVPQETAEAQAQAEKEAAGVPTGPES